VFDTHFPVVPCLTQSVGFVTGRMLGWSLPGGQDRYLKTISELAADGGFTSEKVIEISKIRHGGEGRNDQHEGVISFLSDGVLAWAKP